MVSGLPQTSCDRVAQRAGQRDVRPAHAALVGELEDPLGARVERLVHRVPEARHLVARRGSRDLAHDLDRVPPRPAASSSSRAHSSEVPSTTGPQPRIPAATAPCSDPGSAASVIRAATFVGIIPCSAIDDQQQVEEVALLLGRLLAGQQQVEVLREAEPAHQVAGQVATAHLDAVRVGLADARLGRHGARLTRGESASVTRALRGAVNGSRQLGSKFFA